MNTTTRVAVCSRSFSAHPVLRAELLREFTHVTFNESGQTLKGNSLVQFLRGHDRAIVALETINEDILKNLPELKVIGKYGVGFDQLDFKALARFGVQFGWTGGVNSSAVAELTIGFALMIVRQIPHSIRLVQQGQWTQTKGRQLSSMTVGVLGCGHVGQRVVKLLKPFGARVLVHDVLDVSDFCRAQGADAVSFDTLLRTSDLLTVHIPKNEKTFGLLNRDQLLKMKHGSYLINTARGGLVDESAVLEMLNSGHLLAAAFDVFTDEPPTNRALVEHANVVATAHIGGSSEEAILSMGRAAIEGLSVFKSAGEYV